MKRLLVIAILLIIATGCNEQTSPVNLFVSRADDYGDNITFNQYILFHLKAFCQEGCINRIQGTSFESENGILSVFDTVLNAQTVEFDCPVKTSYYTTSEAMQVKYTFTAYTTDGQSISQVSYVMVKGNVPLLLYDNIVVYSSCNVKTNGLSLQTVSPVIIQTDDIKDIDVYDYHAPELDSTVLSRQWRSMTDMKFVRYNDFNFPGATVSNLINAYMAGQKKTSVDNIMVGDIILVGRDDEAIGVFQIQDLHDEEGYENDRYDVSFKKK